MQGMSFRPSDRIRMLAPMDRRLSGTSRVIPVLCSQSFQSQRLVVPLCEFDGFFPQEKNDGVSFAWTQRSAVITCHFIEPVCVRHIWIPVHSARPGGTRVVVNVSDGPQVNFPRVFSNRRLRIPLGKKLRTNVVRISLCCDTFVPDETLHNGDVRELGIALRRVVLGRNYLACFRGLQGEAYSAEPWSYDATTQAA